MTTHSARVAPAGMASATQQLMSTVHWTVAVALGGVVGGAVGSGRMFKLGAAQSAATFLLCGVGECSRLWAVAVCRDSDGRLMLRTGASLFGRELLGRGVTPDAS